MLAELRHRVEPGEMAAGTEGRQVGICPHLEKQKKETDPLSHPATPAVNGLFR